MVDLDRRSGQGTCVGALARSTLVTSVVGLSSSVAAAAPAPSSRLDRDAALEISRDARASAKDRAFGRLEPRSDGGFDYDDPRDRFSATITADGRVTFTPSRRIDVRRCGGCIPLGGVVDHLLQRQRWEYQPTPNQAGAAAMGGATDLNVALPQNYSLGTKPWSQLPTPIMFGVGGSFGPPVLSDRMKAEFLRETFDLRLRLAIKDERARLSAALSVLEDRLDKLWTDASLPIEVRRERLFLLWDECLDELVPADARTDDDLTSSLVEARHRAASEGRRRILQFIRARAPVGSPTAYRADELRRLNARRVSVEPFDPYGEPLPAAP